MTHVVHEAAKAIFGVEQDFAQRGRSLWTGFWQSQWLIVVVHSAQRILSIICAI